MKSDFTKFRFEKNNNNNKKREKIYNNNKNDDLGWTQGGNRVGQMGDHKIIKMNDKQSVQCKYLCVLLMHSLRMATPTDWGSIALRVILPTVFTATSGLPAG